MSMMNKYWEIYIYIKGEKYRPFNFLKLMFGMEKRISNDANRKKGNKLKIVGAEKERGNH